MGSPLVANGISGPIVGVVIIDIDEDKGLQCGLDSYGCNIIGLNHYLINLSRGYVSIDEYNGTNMGLSVKVLVGGVYNIPMRVSAC